MPFGKPRYSLELSTRSGVSLIDYLESEDIYIAVWRVSGDPAVSDQLLDVRKFIGESLPTESYRHNLSHATVRHVASSSDAFDGWRSRLGERIRLDFHKLPGLGDCLLRLRAWRETEAVGGRLNPTVLLSGAESPLPRSSYISNVVIEETTRAATPSLPRLDRLRVTLTVSHSAPISNSYLNGGPVLVSDLETGEFLDIASVDSVAVGRATSIMRITLNLESLDQLPERFTVAVYRNGRGSPIPDTKYEARWDEMVWGIG